MNPSSIKQIPADWPHYFTWLDMSPEDFSQQTAFQDAAAYLRSYNIPMPDLSIENQPFGAKAGVVATFHINGQNFDVSAIGMVFNPTPTVLDLMHAQLIPLSQVQAYVPPTHVPIVPTTPDISDLAKSVGMILGGYDKETRAIMAAWQGKVPLGTPVTYNGKNYILVDSGSPWNRTGVWQVV